MRYGVMLLTWGIMISIAYISPSYAQLADPTVAGIIVPKVISTQSSYCSNGSCHTGGTSTIPKNYSLSTSHYPVLLITLSQTCETMNKHNMKGCPSIKELMNLDTSNQKVSGKFVENNGIVTREKPPMKNNWLAYVGMSRTVICVECYFDVTATSKSKEIIIQPSSFSYVNKTETEKTGNWYNFYGRYMQGCDTATIANIPGLLNDTVKFMMGNCANGITKFNDTQNHTRTLHPFSYDNPYSTLNHAVFLKDLLHGHSSSNTNRTAGGYGPSDCIRHQCNFIDPYKKAGW